MGMRKSEHDTGTINGHQPHEKPITVRRGEGGEERRGGPLWSPVVACLFPLRERIVPPQRATIRPCKDTPYLSCPSQPHRPRPYGILGPRLRWMPIGQSPLTDLPPSKKCWGKSST